jgi:hypothetical protein
MTTSPAPTLPAIQSVNGASIGTGSSIFSTSSGGTNIVLSFKSLAAGPGASITDNGSTLVVGLDYTPRPTVLNSTSDIVIIGGSSDTSDVFNLGLSTTGVIPGTYPAATITVDAYGRIKMAKTTTVGEANDGYNSGAGAQVYIGKTGTSLGFRSISAGGGLSIQQTDTEILLGTNGLGTVSSVGLISGDGITVSGGPVTTVGQMKVGLQVSGVMPGSYTLPQITVDAYGRITSAASGTVNPPVTAANIGDGDAYVYAQTTDNILQFRGFASGGAVTFAETGTLITVDLAKTGVAGTYTFPVITLDDYGRVTAATGAQPGAVPVASVTFTGTADITASATQTGSAIALTAALAPTGVVAGPYGSATTVPVLAIDANGRVTSASSAAIPMGSTTTAGLLQINASTSSTSTTEAAAPFAVKTAYDLAASKLDASGIAVAAQTLATPRAIALTGDVSGSVSFDGSSDVSIAATLPATGVTPGYYVNAALTVDAKGRITAIANGSPPGTAGSGTVTQVGLTGSAAISVSGSPITASGSFAIDLTATGVVPGTYTNPVISIDAKGRITSATNGTAPSSGSGGSSSGSGPTSYSFRLNYAADGTISVANAPSGWTIGVQGSQVTITHNLGIGVTPTFVCSYGYNGSAFPNAFAQRVPSGATSASYSFVSTNNQFILYSATPNNTSSSNGSYTIVKITI